METSHLVKGSDSVSTVKVQTGFYKNVLTFCSRGTRKPLVTHTVHVLPFEMYQEPFRYITCMSLPCQFWNGLQYWGRTPHHCLHLPCRACSLPFAPPVFKTAYAHSLLHILLLKKRLKPSSLFKPSRQNRFNCFQQKHSRNVAYLVPQGSSVLAAAVELRRWLLHIILL